MFLLNLQINNIKEVQLSILGSILPICVFYTQGLQGQDEMLEK